MEKLLSYLNSLTVADQNAMAALCKTTVGYLRKSCCVNQKLGAELCVSIEQATDGAVTRKDLRPDDWQKIWPELEGV